MRLTLPMSAKLLSTCHHDGGAPGGIGIALKYGASSCVRKGCSTSRRTKNAMQISNAETRRGRSATDISACAPIWLEFISTLHRRLGKLGARSPTLKRRGMEMAGTVQQTS